MVCRQQSGCVDFFQQTFHTGTANRASQVGVDFSVNSNQCWYTRFPGGSFSVVLAFYIVLRHAFQCSNGNSFLHSMLQFPSFPCNRFYLILKCSPWQNKFVLLQIILAHLYFIKSPIRQAISHYYCYFVCLCWTPAFKCLKNRPVVINSTTNAVTLEVFRCNFHPFAIIFPIKFLRKKICSFFVGISFLHMCLLAYIFMSGSGCHIFDIDHLKFFRYFLV